MNSVSLGNIAVLTADDDVDRGDGLREWKFIYVARSSQTALLGCNALSQNSLH